MKYHYTIVIKSFDEVSQRQDLVHQEKTWPLTREQLLAALRGLADEIASGEIPLRRLSD